MIAMTLVCFSLAAGAQEPVPAANPEAFGGGDVRDVGSNILDALGGGNVWLKSRYRYENVDQDGFSNEAHASTLRTVLGYETPAYLGWRGLIEFENVTVVGNDLYDSTVNGETTRPVVSDPETTEVNRAYVEWGGHESTIRIGRQRIVLGNKRFISNVAWRQNEQTYDAVSLQSLVLGSFDFFLAFLHNVNRVVGEESPVGDANMASFALHVERDLAPDHKAWAYWYRLDYDDLPSLSTSTVGLRLTGKARLGESDTLSYGLEGALQNDVEENPADIDASYEALELAWTRGAGRLALGYESLGGSGGVGEAFQTPLATLHAFNGWTDRFPVTPDTGLNDVFVTYERELGSTSVTLAVHDFSAEAGDADYGKEVGVHVVHEVSERVRLGIKYATYSADDFSTDTEKLWFWLEVAP